MKNQHSDVITRDILYQGEIKEIEERLGVNPIKAFTFDQIYDAYVKKVPIAEAVTVSSNLVAAKVMQTVLDGATFFGEKWRKITNISNLTEEQEKVPISSEADFEVHNGLNRPAISSGGEITELAFDVTDDDKDHSVWVSLKKKTADRKKFAVLQDMSKKASRKLNKFILDDVTDFISDNAGTTEDLAANDRYTAVSNLMAKLEEAGFAAEVAAMTPTQLAKVLQTQVGTGGPMPFITNTMIDKNGNAIRGLQAGEDYMLLGNIPGIKAVNTNIATEILVASKNSVNMGKFGDIRIENWEDPFKALKGFSIAVTYELKANSKLDIGLGKVTGA